MPLFFQLLDLLYAFQSKVQMAAKELLGLHLAGLDEHAPLLYSRVISSYLLSLREDELADPLATSKSSNSPCSIIFFVQLANKLHKAFENQNVTIGYKFLQQLEACIINSGSVDMTRFSQFHILLHSQQHPGSYGDPQQLVSSEFMGKLRDSPPIPGKPARFLNEFVAYACTLGYSKNIEQ